MEELKLVLPDVKYRDSFLSAIPEFRALEHKRWQDTAMAEMNENMLDAEFSDYIKNLYDRMNYPKPGTSRKFTYWLIDKDGWAGTIRIRPDLSKAQAENYGHIGFEIRPSKRGRGYSRQMIRMAMAESSKLGLSQVCLSCENNNEPSKKTIENTFNEYGGDGGHISETDYYCWINTIKK